MYLPGLVVSMILYNTRWNPIIKVYHYNESGQSSQDCVCLRVFFSVEQDRKFTISFIKRIE